VIFAKLTSIQLLAGHCSICPGQIWQTNLMCLYCRCWCDQVKYVETFFFNYLWNSYI